jgi:hypothetical protein
MNGTVFWDITQCSPLKSLPMFRKNKAPPSSEYKSKHRLFVTFHAGLCLNYATRSETKWGKC